MEKQNKLIVILTSVLIFAILILGFFFPVDAKILILPLFFILAFILCLIKIEIVLLFAFVSILFSPEIQLFSLSGFSKSVYIRLEDLIILVAFIGLIGNRAIRKKTIFKSTPLNLPLLSFMGIYILATWRGIFVGAVDGLSSIFVVVKIAEFLTFCFITIGFLEERKQCRMVISAFFVIAFLILLFYLPQVFLRDYSAPGYRIGSPFEGGAEPTTTGGVLILIISMALGMLIFEKRKGPRTLYILMIILAIIPFFATLSRTSYIAAFVAFMFFAIFARKIWLLVIMPVILGLLPIVLPATVWARISYTWTYKSAGAFFDQSTMERIDIWGKIIPHFRRSPFMGYGANYLNVIDSNYARILVETGALGMAVFIWIFIRIYRMSYTLYRDETGWVKGFALAYLVIVTALLVHGLAAITFFIVRIVEFFWTFTAVMVFLYISREARSGSPVEIREVN